MRSTNTASAPPTWAPTPSCPSPFCPTRSPSKSARSSPPPEPGVAVEEGPRLPAICGGLDAVELRVRSTRGHQLLVGAGLGDARAVEHHDQVGHADRRK